MPDLLSSLWPLFALIIGGQILWRSGFPDPAFWPGAERFNYFVLFPALLFRSLATAPLNTPGMGRLLVAVLLALALCWALLLLAQRWRGWPAARFGVVLQGAVRFNTYLGLATISSLFGPPGLTLAALLLAVMVPTVNVMSVLALLRGQHASWRALLLPLLRNPLIMACVLGAAFNLLGWHLDGGTHRLLGLLADTSLPLGLLCVGAALRPQELRGELGAVTGLTVLRLLLVPALAWGIAVGMALPAMPTAIMVLFFALPTAPTAYVLTRQLGGDSQLMAGVITLQTLAAAITLPAWLLLLPR